MSESLFQSHAFSRYYRNLEPLFAKKETRAYTMLLLSIFVVVFFSIFAIKPTLNTIALLRRQILDGASLNEQLETKINSLVSAQEEYLRVQNDLPLIYSLLPQASEFSLLLRKIEVIALDHQARISGISFEPVILYDKNSVVQDAITAASEEIAVSPTAENISIVPIKFNISISGSYENVVQLLERLTSENRLITVDTLGFTPSKTDSGDATIELGILARAYYFPTIQ